MTPYRPEPGDLPPEFGPYRVLGQLGRGGMATVYLVRNTLLDRPEALKLPDATVLKNPRLLERFRREARAASQFDHPGLCHVYDAGDIDGRPFLTMAYVEGRPLTDLVADFAAGPPRAA